MFIVTSTTKIYKGAEGMEFFVGLMAKIKTVLIVVNPHFLDPYYQPTKHFQISLNYLRT
jgi:hypothetical protein